jgi:hypothetical protein
MPMPHGYEGFAAPRLPHRFSEDAGLFELMRQIFERQDELDARQQKMMALLTKIAQVSGIDLNAN